MKILLTADPAIPIPPIGYGGIERIVDALARQYQAHGHQVGLLAHADSTCAVDSRFGWRPTAAGPRVTAVRNTLSLARAVMRFRPDVIHSFSRLAYLTPVLPLSLPKVMSYQRHVGGRQISIAAKVAGKSLRFTGCSEFICAMGRPSGGTWIPIPNFVELDKISFSPEVPRDAPLVFLSRIESIKGPDLAIDIARASGRRLILAGNRASSGPEQEFWSKRIEPQIGRNGIEWIGEVNDAQKNSLLGQAAALVVPIRWDEPFGIVFAEALAAGTPVITCARGAAPEIVVEGKTGYFVSTTQEGASAVARLGEIGRANCRQAAEDRFSSVACARKYLSVFEEMSR